MSNSKKIAINFLKYILITVSFVSLNSVIPNVFFSYALYVGLLYASFSPIPLAVCFALSFAIFKSYQMLLIGLCVASIFCFIFLLYSKKKKTPKIEVVLYFFLSVIPYILIGEFSINKVVYSAIICLFSFISIQGVSVFISIKNRCKSDTFSLICLSIIFSMASVGFINIFGVNAYKTVACLILLFSQNCFEKYAPYYICGLLASPLAITQKNASFFCSIFLWFFFSLIFQNKRFFQAIGIIIAECVSVYVLNVIPIFNATDLLFVVIPALLFAFLPDAVFKKINDYLNLNPKEVLYNNLINRTRAQISAKLYEMSGVFFQMQSSFIELKSSSVSKEEIIENITKETVSNVCLSCTFYDRCKQKNQPNDQTFNSFITVGLAKQRLTLFDLPRVFTDVCAYPNSIIFEVNRLIGSYLDLIKQSEEISSSKEIISTQTESIGQILKNLAFDFSKVYENFPSQENSLSQGLKKLGFYISGALILGEGIDLEIYLFTTERTYKNPNFLHALETVVGESLTFFSVLAFNDDLLLVGVKKRPPIDAIFGVSQSTKTGSKYSGDTHSIIKISEGKFLACLSDGMGSGEVAKNTSSVTINLIESFYHAGLDSQTIINSVNSILTLNNNENFSAVDIAVCDLYAKKVDFIKIGAPDGFIVNNNGVKFIEGASLPIGILDDVCPSNLTATVDSGDVLVLMSDGVTDAFSSTVDITEFLRAQKLKNPQYLADAIVERATALCGGIKRDDLTCLCVRLIDKNAS